MGQILILTFLVLQMSQGMSGWDWRPMALILFAIWVYFIVCGQWSWLHIIFPPWLCIKNLYFMLTLSILGPQAPGKDMDVFLRPLIGELKELWVSEVETRDTVDNSIFTMRTTLLWTVIDFPAWSSLSRWSGKSYKAYLTCNEYTPLLRVRSKNVYFGHIRFLPITHPMRRSRKFNGKAKKDLHLEDGPLKTFLDKWANC